MDEPWLSLQSQGEGGLVAECPPHGGTPCLFSVLWVFLASVGKSSATQGGCYATNDTLSSKKQQSLQVLKLQV